MMNYEKPLPKVNSDNRPFWEGCRKHFLQFQRCAVCGQVRWPPSRFCPQCHTDETRWIRASGRGKVYSHVVYRVVYHPAFATDIPYVVAVVQLVEGPLFLSNIVGCDPEQVFCGMEVIVTWEDVTPTLSLPKFRPATAGFTENDP